jgi:hypothetical protein
VRPQFRSGPVRQAAPCRRADRVGADNIVEPAQQLVDVGRHTPSGRVEDRKFWLDALSDLPEVVSVSGRLPTETPYASIRHIQEVHPRVWPTQRESRNADIYSAEENRDNADTWSPTSFPLRTPPEGQDGQGAFCAGPMKAGCGMAGEAVFLLRWTSPSKEGRSS